MFCVRMLDVFIDCPEFLFFPLASCYLFCSFLLFRFLFSDVLLVSLATQAATCVLSSPLTNSYFLPCLFLFSGIAYHNLAVELEFMRDYQQALQVRFSCYAIRSRSDTFSACLLFSLGIHL